MPLPSLIPPQVAPRPQISTTSYSDPLKAMTIKALQERQKSLQNQQVEMPSMLSPWQGASYALDKFMQGLKTGSTDRAELAAERGRADLFGQIDPVTGATTEQISQMMNFDPEIAQALWLDRAKRAQAEQWEDIPPPPGAAPGSIWQRNKATGEVQEEGGASSAVTVQNLPETKGETKWEETNAKNLGDQLNNVAAGGYDAIARSHQVDLLEGFLPQMFQSGSENLIAQWMQQNWGINLGERADAATAFNSIVNSLVPEQRPPGSGTMSDRDVLLFQTFLPKLANSPNGNKLIVSYLRGMANYRRQMGDIANRAMALSSPKEARDFFYGEAAKLANPLAGLEEQVRALETQPDAGGGGGGGGGGDPTVDDILRRNGIIQ
jgi:hypothetical protein